MKTNSKTPGVARVLFLSIATAGLLVSAARTSAESGYVAHEWGTFTSIQGSDGVQLDWNSRQVAELPGFVYNWTKPGGDRIAAADLNLTKTVLTTKQRMETPVVYFYGDEERAIDVSVQFPRGKITEWYPQARQIGPGLMPKNAPTDAALVFPDSRIRWSGIQILSKKESAEAAALVPSDKSGSHYFAARETDSALLRTDGLTAANSTEHEKFLFYRGVGDFATPLKVTSSPGGELTLTNTGKDPLVHLFVLQVRNGSGTALHVERLAPGDRRTVSLTNDQPVELNVLSEELGRAMADALREAGLFPREATAMVNTWKDTWFADEGVRVLYVLPRAWTDVTLPMTLTPAPRNLVRVMVGRAEVITPAMETTLWQMLQKAQRGDTAARDEATGELRKLGRFAETALRLVKVHHGPAPAADLGYRLLAGTQPPSTFE